MLEISSRSIEEGMELATLIIPCHDDFLECLWLRGEKCGDCRLVDFRKKFEEQSPAFFGLFKKISEFEVIIDKLNEENLLNNPQQKYEARERFHDLQTFAESSIAALYPLFKSNNNCFPFLKVQEIEEIQKNYLLCDPKKAEKELREISQEWLSVLGAIFMSFHTKEKDLWAKKVYLLIRIFLCGTGKEEKKFINETFLSGAGDDLSGDVEKFLGIKKIPPKESI